MQRILSKPPSYLESGKKRTRVAWSSSTLTRMQRCSLSKMSLVLQIRTVRSSEQDAKYFPLLLKSRHVTFPLWPCRIKIKLSFGLLINPSVLYTGYLLSKERKAVKNSKKRIYLKIVDIRKKNITIRSRKPHDLYTPYPILPQTFQPQNRLIQL